MTPAAALLFAALPATAGLNNTGVSGASFLQLGAGARALGMGEAFGSVAEGAEAIYWNPAGLAQLPRPELAYARTELMHGRSHHDFGAFAYPIKAIKTTLAASFTHVSQDSLRVVNNAGVETGPDFTPYSQAFALAVAGKWRIGEFINEGNREYFGEKWEIAGTYRPYPVEEEPWTGVLMAGFAMKVINESLYRERAFAWGFDGGVLYRPQGLESLSMSFAFRNVGTKERFNVSDEALPMEFDVGAAYDWRQERHRLVSAFEIAAPYYGPPYGKLGFEYTMPLGRFLAGSLRAGYKTLVAPDLDALAGLTCGGGWRYRRLRFDFGFQPLNELGQVYRFSLGTAF